MAVQYAHLNPYNYAGNKPINSIDIDGMQGKDEPKSESSGETPTAGGKTGSGLKKDNIKYNATDADGNYNDGVHTVSKGNTLWNISQKYGVGVDDLVAANESLKDVNSVIKPGDKLIIDGQAAEKKQNIEDIKAFVKDYQKNQSKSESKSSSSSEAQSNESLKKAINTADIINSGVSSGIGSYLALSKESLDLLGGTTKFQELINAGKFEAIYNGITRQWSLNFPGNKSVPATFVQAEKVKFLNQAITEAENIATIANNAETAYAKTRNFIKGAGKVTIVLGFIITGASIATEGFNRDNTSDFIFGIAGFIPVAGVIIAGSYFIIENTIGKERAAEAFTNTMENFRSNHNGESFFQKPF